MVTEEQKYLAEVFRILGFSFMVPFGKLILNVRQEFSHVSIGFVFYFAFILLLVYFGIMLLLKGSDKVKEKRKQSWTYLK